MKSRLVLLGLLLAAHCAAQDCVELVRFSRCVYSDTSEVFTGEFFVLCRSEPAKFLLTSTAYYRAPGYRGYETLGHSERWFYEMPYLTYFMFDWRFHRPGVYWFVVQADPACPDSLCVEPPCNRHFCLVDWRVADIAVDLTLESYLFTGPVTVRAELLDRTTGEPVRPMWLTNITANGILRLREAPFGHWKLRLSIPGGSWLSRSVDVLIQQRDFVAPPVSLPNGDATRNGCIDTEDLASVLTRFGHVGGPADMDNDGRVALPDLAMVVVNFAKCNQ